MGLAADILRLSGHCWGGFQGQRSNVKVVKRPNVIIAGGMHFHGVASRLFVQKIFWQFNYQHLYRTFGTCEQLL